MCIIFLSTCLSECLWNSESPDCKLQRSPRSWSCSQSAAKGAVQGTSFCPHWQPLSQPVSAMSSIDFICLVGWIYYCYGCWVCLPWLLLCLVVSPQLKHLKSICYCWKCKCFINIYTVFFSRSRKCACLETVFSCGFGMPASVYSSRTVDMRSIDNKLRWPHLL